MCVCVCVCARARARARVCVKIQEDANYRGLGKGTIYVCLKLLYPYTSERPECTHLMRPLSSSAFDPLHLIELSHNTFRQTDLEPFLFSQQLGTKLHELYDLDLDFTDSHTMLAAILTNGGNKNTTWYLMTEPRPPPQGDCSGDSECVTSSSTSSGHVVFPRHLAKLQNGHVYYVCAVTSVMTSGSWQTDHQACGDGVVVDDSPPVQGSVSIVGSDSGYLADGGHLTVTWSGFSDVETQVHSLPDDITLTYSVALGKFQVFFSSHK